MKVSISIVIAVFNGAEFLKKCLPAIAEAADTEVEIILVDDGSTDESASIGKQFGADILTLNKRRGAAHARNSGVRKARGEIIIFIDADVVMAASALNDVRKVFAENPSIAALFGSYDDSPAAPDFFSQYRNLMHHFFHQAGRREAETFWSGFGAIKREIFLAIGGFDAEKFEIPAVEDIELGYRLREKGYRILLVPELQAKHLKRWTFLSILRTDFWQRAVPWSEILLLNPQVKHQLNAQTSQKISALLAGIFISSLLLLLWRWWFLTIAAGSLCAMIFINREFYRFFLQRKGLLFMLRVLPMHLLYFFYSSGAFVYSWINVKILRRTVIVR